MFFKAIQMNVKTSLEENFIIGIMVLIWSVY